MTKLKTIQFDVETKQAYLVLNQATGFRRTVSGFDLRSVAASAQWNRKMRPDSPVDIGVDLAVRLLTECGFTVESVEGNAPSWPATHVMHGMYDLA